MFCGLDVCVCVAQQQYSLSSWTMQLTRQQKLCNPRRLVCSVVYQQTAAVSSAILSSTSVMHIRPCHSLSSSTGAFTSHVCPCSAQQQSHPVKVPDCGSKSQRAQ